MEYITRNCPKCNGELQIPADLKNCICMYCGESFKSQEDKPTAMSKANSEAMEMDYHKALKNLRILTDDYELQLSKFTANKYADGFEEYKQRCIPILNRFRQYASLSEDNIHAMVTELTSAIIQLIEKDIAVKSSKNKTPKATIIDQYRFFLTVYLVPMVRNLNYNFSEPFADSMIEVWAEKYPKYPFQKSEYDKLLEGFKRKGMCFITTAVCETMNKEDDCSELMAFRHFRDTYMLETQERMALVEEYYLVAPVIVTSINMRSDSSETYKQIWMKYLQPCLKAIEEKRLDDCEDQYSKMVKELKHQYYFRNIKPAHDH